MIQVTPVHPVVPARDAASCWYSVYDLSVRSDVPLPIVPLLPRAHATPDVVVRRIDTNCPVALDEPAVAQLSCPVHGTHMREYRRADGVWIWLRGIGTFHVTPDAARVDVYAGEGADAQALGLAIVGPVLTFVRHLHGCPSLHASAIVAADGAVAFLGPRGRGKSTMATAFLRRGARLVSDDALPLLLRDDGVYGAPGPAFLKVWRTTAQQTLALDDELPDLLPNVDKKLLTLEGRFGFARTPVRLRALYVLERYDPEAAGRTDVAFRSPRPREALLALVAHTSSRAYLVPDDEALLVRTYARMLPMLPVYVLAYPDGFAHQEAVCARILAHLEEP